MKKILFVPVLLSLLWLTACDPTTRGHGEIITETRNETGFHAIDMASSGRVEVRKDSVFHLEVSCEESLLPYLETTVENGILKVYFNRNVWDVDGLRILVSAPAWDGFDLSGSGRINVYDAIEGNELKLNVSGSGDVIVDDADFLTTKAKVSGSGNVVIRGQGNVLSGTVSGSGNLDALDFPVKNATTSVSGSGNIQLNVSETLHATVSGSGNISYKGNPQVTSEVSGSGKVRKL